MTSQIPSTASRLQRVLAYIVAACVILSFVAIAAVLAGTAMGAGAHDGFSHGLWPAVLVTPMIGFPLGFVLMMALLWLSTAAKKRYARATGAREPRRRRGGR